MSPASRDRASAAAHRSASASPRLGQHDGQHAAARRAIMPGMSPGICPACRASSTAPSRSPAESVGRPPGPRLPGRVPDLPGHGQGAAAILDRLGSRPAAAMHDRPARQSTSTRDGGRSSRASRTAVKWSSAAVMSAGRAPPRRARTARRATRAPRPGGRRPGAAAGIHPQPAPQVPPGRQRNRQPQRDGRVVLHRPGQDLVHRRILGVQPSDSGQLPSAGRQAGRGLLGHLQRVLGQRGGGGVLLARLGQQPGPVGTQRLQHDVPGPAIRAGPRRNDQRAVHQLQHHRAGAWPGDCVGGLQRERAGEHRQRAEHPPLLLISSW